MEVVKNMRNEGGELQEAGAPYYLASWTHREPFFWW